MLCGTDGLSGENGVDVVVKEFNWEDVARKVLLIVMRLETPIVILLRNVQELIKKQSNKGILKMV